MAQIVYAKLKECLWVVSIVCAAGWFIGGCASYNVQTQKISQSYGQGNIQAAATQISAEADKRGEGKDAVVWRLEQGAVLRAAGKPEESNRAFDKAEELVNKYEDAAKTSASREALAAVTNLTALPYEGFAYDKIMMNTYKALNYLALGDYEKARVEFNRVLKRQEDAVYINKARIEKAQEEGEKQDLNVDIDKIGNDAKFKRQFDSAYADLNQYKYEAEYKNPVAVYLDALFFMAHATGNSDLERSRKSFEYVLGMTGENKFIQQDMETLQQVISGQPVPPTTYVIFETGLAPEREEIRIDLPLFLIKPGVPYVGAAFPKLKYRGNHLSILNVSYEVSVTSENKAIHPGKKTQAVIKLREKRRGHLATKETTENTILLSCMDNIIAREFKNELPVVITKTIIASAVKAAVTYGASRAASQKSDTAGFVTLIAGAIYQAATNSADLRTWTSLPKEFQFCRFPTPVDREIELEPPFSGNKLPVSIDGGRINVVWVKSISRGGPLLVSQFKLMDETKVVAIAPPPETAATKEIPPQEPTIPAQPEEMLSQETTKSGQEGQTNTWAADSVTLHQETAKPEQEIQSAQPAPPAEQTAHETPPEAALSEQMSQSEPLNIEQLNEGNQPEVSSLQEPAEPEQPAQMLPHEAATPEQETQPAQPASPAGQITRDAQPEAAMPEQPTRLSQPETSPLDQSYQQEKAKPEQQVQETQHEIPNAEQPIQGEGMQTSIKQELSADTAKRTERERFLAMLNTLDETKKQRIVSVHREVHNDFKKRDWNAVVQKCRGALEIDHEDYFAYGNLGSAYAMLNEFDLSIEYSAKASRLIPALPDAYIQMVYAYARKGDKDQAFEFLEMAVGRGFKDINHLRNDTDLPEYFRKDTRLNNY